MGQIANGFKGILAGFIISVASFGLLLISIGFSAVRSGVAFTPYNPVVAVLRLIFYLGMFVMFGSPFYFWIFRPVKRVVEKFWKEKVRKKA